MKSILDHIKKITPKHQISTSTTLHTPHTSHPNQPIEKRSPVSKIFPKKKNTTNTHPKNTHTHTTRTFAATVSGTFLISKVIPPNCRLHYLRLLALLTANRCALSCPFFPTPGKTHFPQIFIPRPPAGGGINRGKMAAEKKRNGGRSRVIKMAPRVIFAGAFHMRENKRSLLKSSVGAFFCRRFLVY